MLDSENALQQEALGIVGVNLIYGAFCLNHEPEKLIESLLDNLSTRRIEIDMIEFSGIAFRHVDNRVMSLRLVQLGLSSAAMFSATGEVLHPLLIHREEKNVLLIVVTGDKGLAGAFNANILKAATRFIDSKSGKNIEIEAVGRKGRDFLKRRFKSAEPRKAD